MSVFLFFGNEGGGFSVTLLDSFEDGMGINNLGFYFDSFLFNYFYYLV
jgi:hypothetical protein